MELWLAGTSASRMVAMKVASMAALMEHQMVDGSAVKKAAWMEARWAER